MHCSLKGWLVMGLLVGTAVYALAEDITLTTYYPSPRGVYQELRSTANTYLATDGGQVGIGTASPLDRKLVISGSGTAGGIELIDPAAGGGTWDITPHWVAADGNFSILRAAGTGDILLAPAGGNVGIGTTGPNPAAPNGQPGHLDVWDLRYDRGWKQPDLGGLELRWPNELRQHQPVQPHLPPRPVKHVKDAGSRRVWTHDRTAGWW